MTEAADQSTDRVEQRVEHHEVRISVPVADVWAQLTTSEGLASWYGVEASIDPVPGGELTVGWGPDGGTVRARVTHVEPGAERARLRYEYVGEETGSEEWLLAHDHDAGVTHVRLVHRLPDPGVDDWEGWYGDFRRGWQLFLASLRWSLEAADRPTRVAECRVVRLGHDERAVAWRDVAARLAIPDHADVGTWIPSVDASILLLDAPHSILLARGGAATLFVDLEGTPGGLVRFVQSATYGIDDPDLAAAVRRELLDAAT